VQRQPLWGWLVGHLHGLHHAEQLKAPKGQLQLSIVYFVNFNSCISQPTSLEGAREA
jgi:hypothetical protein